MAGRKLRRGRHKDQFDIVTTDVTTPADGSVAKTSKVHVDARDDRGQKDLWVGLKIGRHQQLRRLEVDGKTWVDRNTVPNAPAARRFREILGTNFGEKWAAYLIDKSLKPGRPDFATALSLWPAEASDPDAQVVTIAVCYVPEDPSRLTRRDIILGHSLVQAPPKSTRKRKGRAKRTRTSGRTTRARPRSPR